MDIHLLPYLSELILALAMSLWAWWFHRITSDLRRYLEEVKERLKAAGLNENQFLNNMVQNTWFRNTFVCKELQEMPWYELWIEFFLLDMKLRRLRRTNIRAMEHADERPPRLAERLLSFFPKEVREPLSGDLEEEYREIYKKFGKRKAKVWYWNQVVASFFTMVACRIKKLVMRSIRSLIS